MFDPDNRIPLPSPEPELVGPHMPTGPPGPTAGQQRLIAALEILLCSSVPTQLAIGFALRLFGLSANTSTGQLSFGFVVALSIVDTFVLFGLMVWLTRAHGESTKELWLGQRRVIREVALGLGLIPVVFAIVALLMGVLRVYAPWLHNVPTNPLEELASTSVTDAVLFGLVAILAGGLREELQRAFLLRRFERHLGGPAIGVLVLSVAFGLGHYLQGWDAVITTGTLGAFWAVIYLRRRSAVAPVISHAAFNSLEILRVVVGS